MRTINETRLAKTLEFIVEFQRQNGKTPTYREIMRGCGYSSLGSVSADVARLKERDLLQTSTDSSWNTIYIPDNLRTGRTHKAAIVGAVHCGEPVEAIENIEATVLLPEAIFGAGEHFLLYAKGRSMIQRGIFDGDLLVVRKQSVANVGQTIIARVNGEEATAKVYALKNGKPYLKAANNELDAHGKRIYRDIYPKGEWDILGIVDYVIHAPKQNEF